MTIYETHTDLSPAEVLRRALACLPHAGTPYAAFPGEAGPGSLRLRMEVGEIVIAAVRQDDRTYVRASGSRGMHLVSHFLGALGMPLDVRQTTSRRGTRVRCGAQVKVFAGEARVTARTSAPALPLAA